MSVTATIKYWGGFGPGEGGDVIEWDIELSGEAEKTYRHARIMGLPMEKQPGMQEILDEVYEEIEQQEIQNLLGYEDEYTMKCMGTLEVEADEINRLVVERDPHTLAFFDLTELNEKELDEWDANDLVELPAIRDFYEDFEPYSPFSAGYSLYVEFPDDISITKEEIREEFSNLLREANGNYTTARDYLKRCDSIYWGDDLTALAAEIAEELGLTDFAAELRGKS